MPATIQLYNSLSRRVEPLEPHVPGIVGIYTCGPTVYRYAHIGNVRSFLFPDVLRRTLEYLGYEVRHVKNITDVGHMRDDTDQDRDGARGGDRGQDARPRSRSSTPMPGSTDEAALNILPVHVFPKATEHIGPR